MQRVRLAAFVAGASLQFVLPSGSHFSSGTSLHPQVWTLQLARLCREQSMSGTFTSISHCEVSLHISGFGNTYHAHPARHWREKSDGSATRPADSFLGETTP